MSGTFDFRSLARQIVDWIYPPVCVSCGEHGSLLCGNCRSALPRVEAPFCPKCGKPLRKGSRGCRLCSFSEFSFTASRAPYIYKGPAAVMIRELKYKGAMGLIPILADLLYDFWPELHWDTDVIIPVPLSDKRKGQRGFNQSEMIGRAFARKAGIVFDPRALAKIRHTAQQVGLKADERRRNLNGAFAAERLLVQGKRILLLDDVMTTGSTFSECSAVLLDAGAVSVHCLSVTTTSTEDETQAILNTV